MATTSNYYLNNSTLSTATCVYDDSDMSIISPDGWYADGVIVRQQISGVLQPVEPCPLCPGSSANVNYYSENRVTTPCYSSVTSWTLVAIQAPYYYYINATGTTGTGNKSGTANIPVGATTIEFSFDYSFISGTCHRMQIVIEVDGSVVALKQFPSLVSGNTYSHQYSMTLNSNSTIKGYVEIY